MSKYRTHNCGELRTEHIGQNVKLAGWVDTVRDHGGVIFLDLRDHYGVTQTVFHDETMLEGISRESVISVEGKVVKRDEETVNNKIATGQVEVVVDKIEVLGPAIARLPFIPGESTATREDVRLKYRFLDLRNPEMHDVIVLRSKVISFLRKKMEELGFVEIQTPILTCSSPEGARDYLVPSRKHKGKFYALPQAPQQFKQLLMASGFDKYFQIAPCFRDEDARADRSPGEFYQLDFEMAFAEQEDVLKVAETVLYETFTAFSDFPVSKPPFKRIPYAEAMLTYGTDKPDLRNPLIIKDLTDLFADVDFPAFKGRPVRGIKADCTGKSRSFFENMLKFALSIGMKGLGYLTLAGDTFKGPIDKFLTPEKKAELIRIVDLKDGETVFFICDSLPIVNTYAGQIRTELCNQLGLLDKDRFEMCFITDFPMYEINEETGKIDFTHNPFSMPQGGLEALNNQDPLTILAYQYDIVCNGVELSSGAVRNHHPEIMQKAFEIAGYSHEELKAKFGALYTAFTYGAPPHAGMAPGVDRMIMLLAGKNNIRDVIAFPLNSNAQDLLLGAPNEVTEKQLREVHIKLR
ncbi:MAG: aspartate--tRNA ligase [Clostridiales bacterium]|jgi:aspartyl-tRNA synthetase|nr:aspartate--tRNA ligase [Clostridiales bacterium]HOA33782.1 aspartate--tRNA ligase [Clostridiales bacterium]HOL78736.1 aspartate--tRNA ligase [Clostridiales bacterium]HPP68207.1 aspartate--tRNA ligase [Clostridiales bacterium]HPU67535.1 aspartate--tRNA ligase [Clostridiales bacterium]